RADTTRAAFFTSHRARLTLAYKREKFAAVFSIQEIRTWGAQDPRSTAGTVQIFEAYAEPYITNNFSVRIGKQRIMYDNQRLFAQNDWRQNAGTHDAINFRYYKELFETELAFAFNQTSEPLFFTPFAPVGFTNYKILGVSYIKYKTKNQKWAFTTINYFDGFQIAGANNTEKVNFRYTDGGRIEYLGKVYLTVSGYIQHGKNPAGKELSAYYFQPEVKYTINKKTEIRLGAEIKSGNNPSNTTTTVDHAFQYPYGVAHRFNGTMEYFASGYPGSKKDVGLINPYLFIEQKLGEKIAVSLQNHLFFSQYGSLDANAKPVNEYLGFESDFLFVYRPNNFTKLDFGFSTLLGTESLEFIAGGNHERTPFWSYVQITLTPKLFSIGNKW
ncbi:MAG: alginate export family protein, partial [Cytophagaceae bacterium]|nr:alginate export family protein [Cytophagaceae bacterium]